MTMDKPQRLSPHNKIVKGNMHARRDCAISFYHVVRKLLIKKRNCGTGNTKALDETGKEFTATIQTFDTNCTTNTESIVIALQKIAEQLVALNKTLTPKNDTTGGPITGGAFPEDGRSRITLGKERPRSLCCDASPIGSAESRYRR